MCLSHRQPTGPLLRPCWGEKIGLRGGGGGFQAHFPKPPYHGLPTPLLFWGGGGGWQKASVFGCLPLAVPIGLSPLLILTLCGSERVLVVSTEPPDDLSCFGYSGVGCPGDGLLPMPLTRCIQMHTPSPSWVCRLQHWLVRAGVCICRIIFLTGASNDHNDSFPFVLSFSSFSTLLGGGGTPTYIPQNDPHDVLIIGNMGKITSQRLLDQSQARVYMGKTPHTPPILAFLGLFAYPTPKG